MPRALKQDRVGVVTRRGQVMFDAMLYMIKRMKESSKECENKKMGDETTPYAQRKDRDDAMPRGGQKRLSVLIDQRWLGELRCSDVYE